MNTDTFTTPADAFKQGYEKGYEFAIQMAELEGVAPEVIRQLKHTYELLQTKTEE